MLKQHKTPTALSGLPANSRSNPSEGLFSTSPSKNEVEFPLSIRKTSDELAGNSESHIKVAVIGGGIAGCTTTMKLATMKLKNCSVDVHIFEASDKLLRMSSAATPCRLAVLHYVDEETAELMLDTSVDLVRHLIKKTGSPFIVQQYDNGHFSPKRTYYVIMRDSVVPLAEVRQAFNRRKDQYAKLIERDPENAVFGPLKDFYHEVPKEKLRGIVNLEDVVAVFDTCETIFDWPMLQSHIVGKIHLYPNATVHMNTKIDSITRLPNLKMEIKSAQLPAPEQFDYVFNCSWFSVDQLNRTFESSTQQPINHIESNNRIKVMAVLTNIPETLKNKSILLGFGPYSSLITRITDGVEEGYLTSERITNFAQISSNSTMSEEQLALVTDKLPNHRKRAIGELIIDDAKKFIPPLAECELSKLKAGVVRTNGGPIDIYARDGHFSRTFMGVYHVALGLIVNEARKFIFWNKNCNKAIELLQEQIAVKSQIDSILDRTMNQSKRSEDLLKVLACHVDQEVIGKAPLETDTASNNLKKNLGIFATTSDRKIETNNTIRLFASYRSELAENTKLAVALKKF